MKSNIKSNMKSFGRSKVASATSFLTSNNMLRLNPLPTESDNHADTHCFGKNFRPTFFTELECTVSPFLSSYENTENVKVCTAATAYTNEHGRTYIMIFGQGLWFGEKMEKSLINPNQCRDFGVQVCDDPTDPNRKLGYYPEIEFMPMTMVGSTATIMTSYPTDLQMDTCEHVIMSNENYWDPTQVHFNVSSVVGENYGENPRSILATRLISEVQVRDVSMVTEERHHTLTPEALAQMWQCGLKTARATIKATTQLGIRSALHPLSRRYRTDIMSQNLTRLNTTFYSDTMFAKCTSLNGNAVAQVFTDGQGYYHAEPLVSKAQAGEALDSFAATVGVPNVMVTDGAMEQTGPNSHFQKSLKRMGVLHKTTEPYSQWQNRAEAGIHDIKKKWSRRMIRKGVPRKLWDYGIVYECEIMSRTAKGKAGRTGLERLTGNTTDISEWADFEFYDWCWYWDSTEAEVNPKIGRWLGVSHRVGSALCYWVLTESGKVIARTTVQHMTTTDLSTDENKAKVEVFTERITKILGDDNYVNEQSELEQFVNEDVPSREEVMYGNLYPENEGEFLGLSEIPEVDDYGRQEGMVEGEDSYDSYLGVEVWLPGRSEENQMGKVLKRVKGNDGAAVGTSNSNPMLDTSEYEVQFPDGHVEELTANVIAESMFSQVDDEGHHFQLMKEITDHKSDGRAITIENGYDTSRNGNKVPKKTTCGWKLLVEWKDGSSDWVALKDLKAANPVEVAEYAVANQISSEPAFNWWIKDILKRRNRIIGKMKSKYWRTTHKFGIRVPKTVKEALAIDDQNGNTFWQDAIKKEMTNVDMAFKAGDISVEEARAGKTLVGYQEIKCHMIFDIKMDGKFTRKARLVAGGHTTDPPASATYSSVVSRDSVRIAFMMAALNDLEVCAADVGNAYLNAPCREKIWTIAGLEFGSRAGTVQVIVRALYGLKSSGAAWRAMFAQSLLDQGFQSTKADPDVWIRAAIKPDGFRYYEMLLVYVDDILLISHATKPTMDAIAKLYRLKGDSIGEPERYLGANIEKVQINDGTVVFSMNCVDYVTNAIANLENTIQRDGGADLKVYGTHAGKRPFPAVYRPEKDVSPLLDDEMTNRYMQLIGILRWAIEIGRVDIITEVSVLSQHQCAPRKGQLDALYRIFWYLKCCLKAGKIARIAFDPKKPQHDEALWIQSLDTDWADFYPDAEEPLPPRMPEPLGNSVKVTTYVDADHAGNVVTRRSHTGILIYCNNTLIVWFSKRQNTVESSSFGSEFVALRIATEMIEGLRYKLRMFGIPVDGPADVFCDNKSVVMNSTVPTSMLNKRHNSICYHRVREAQASRTLRVAWIKGEYNQADLATKTTIGTGPRHEICDAIFHNNAVKVK